MFLMGIEPTAVKSIDGHWHPAYEDNHVGIMVWYNIKYSTKEEAESFARQAIGDIRQAAIEVKAAWNVQKWIGE
jgi:hypothetical protein